MALLLANRVSTVGVRAMDDQHGILLDTLNDLRLALMHGSDRKQVNTLLSQLVEFTRMHFMSEEQLLEQYGYPGLAEHRAEHNNIFGQIRESVQRAQYSEGTQLRSLLGFLRDCYNEHMSGLDLEYGFWFNERGIY